MFPHIIKMPKGEILLVFFYLTTTNIGCIINSVDGFLNEILIHYFFAKKS